MGIPALSSQNIMILQEPKEDHPTQDQQPLLSIMKDKEALALADETIEQVFLYATNAGRDVKTLKSIRRVNRSWKAFTDHTLMNTLWKNLKKEATHLPLSVSILHTSPSWDYFACFKDLTRTLIPHHPGVLGFTAEAYERPFDIALEKIWDRISVGLRMQLDGPVDIKVRNARDIRTWLMDKTNSKKIAKINQLHLTDLDLEILPPEIRYFEKTTHLYLSNNKLQSLPREIESLTQLLQLDLDSNQLTTLPDQIGSLKRLVILNLSNNQLKTLPNQIGSLKILTQLDISKNQITTLPKEMGFLKGLRQLDLSLNPLHTLPLEIEFLTWMNKLIVTHRKD